MADSTDGTVKLQLDVATGDMVSKSELKKRLQKRAKKALSAARAREMPAPDRNSDEQATEATIVDPDAMFKQGFLAEVYESHPTEGVVLRFPPEPNGYLHIGHVKALVANFGFARFLGGKTILRYDDTNPDGEAEEFFLAIYDAIRWLGFTPDAVTYASDYFHQLYNLAEELVRLDKAYVCHCDETQIKRQRGGKDGKEGPRYRCAHADQSADTNLHKFRDMRDGKYEAQKAFLRMKQDIDSGNPKMWDLAAYRISKHQKPHYRTGNEWRIYPTYDFAHCLCDSLEGITHSLCTTEFTSSRESYEWLNTTLGVYEPVQSEYARLSLSGTITSKRKIQNIVDGGHVRGWNDPRLYTLAGLRRRGIPAGAILRFINHLGVTTARTVVEIHRFEHAVREYLEAKVPRLMLVLDPVRVVITDLGHLEGQEVDVPFSVKDQAMGSRKIRFTRVVYIDRADFREVDSENYFRLAPGKSVGLIHFPFPIIAESFSRDPVTRKVIEIQARLNKETKRAKAYIHWVPENCKKVEVRIHSNLFKSDDPAYLDDLMGDLDEGSETTYPNALIEAGFQEIQRKAPWPKTKSESISDGPENTRFQAMRVAYMTVDSDSTDDKVVLNRIVPLKADARKT